VTVPGRDVGSVYILRFGRRNVRKIGHSYDPSKRTDAFNKNIPHEITGKSWAVFETQPTTSPQLAHEIEQRCINALRAKVSEVKCLPAMSRRRSSAYGAMRSCAQSCPTKSSRQPQIITRTRAPRWCIIRLSTHPLLFTPCLSFMCTPAAHCAIHIS